MSDSSQADMLGVRDSKRAFVTRASGTSLMRERLLLAPSTAGLCLEPYGGPRGGGRFLMSEVPLKMPWNQDLQEMFLEVR